jgi:selenium metabolism protein YedF
MKCIIDVRNQSCPIPVVKTRKAMEESDEIEVLISNKDQVSNVTRMAEQSGWQSKTYQKEDHYLVALIKGIHSQDVMLTAEDLSCKTSSQEIARQNIIVISTETMGSGSPELGKILMRSFLNVLKEIDHKPDAILFYNSGVKLTVTDSPFLTELQDLEQIGVKMLVSGTCLDYFKLKENLKVGKVSNMFEIASFMLQNGTAFIR